MPPTALPLNSIAKWSSGSAVDDEAIQLRASSKVYGYGNVSRRLSQTRLLLALPTRDSSSPAFHDRILQLGNEVRISMTSSIHGIAAPTVARTGMPDGSKPSRQNTLTP